MRRNKFSEKYGYIKPRDVLQIENIDSRLKNRIWNIIFNRIFDLIETTGIQIKYKRDTNLINRIHDEFFGTTYKANAYKDDEISKLRSLYNSMEWFTIYDFIEELVFLHYDEEIKRLFKISLNHILEEEMAAYRFIDDCIAPIIDEVEINEIEEVFNCQFNPVKAHLSKALELLSDRENPDFTNSIKESISAVESMVNIFSGTTNVALNRAINNLVFDIDKNFTKGMINLYSWTSSADGIRHANSNDEIKSAFDEAKYMVVSCSAFINYLILKHEKSGG